MSKEVIMKCPDCGTIVKGKYGFLKQEFTCPGCSKKINPKNDSYETVVCRHCGNTVIHDTRVGSDQNCPACGYSLSQHNVSDIELTCPSCHMNQRVKYNEITHTCPICNFTFNVEKLKGVKNASESGAATVITVPDNNTDVIWKHPMTYFPFASHVVVPEGYSALILRDGICSSPAGTGKYLLSDTIRTITEQLEYATLEKNAQVSVQIFYVRKNIDKQMKWVVIKQPVSYPNGELAGSLSFGGGITVSVSDAKRFVEFVGYENASADKLIVTQAEDGNNSKLYEKVKSICADVVEQVLKSAVYTNGFAFTVLDQNSSYFKGLAQPEIDRLLNEIGLKISLFSLDFVRFEEDEERIKEKEQNKAHVETAEMIDRHIETLFDWESPIVPIHMKNDITLSADVKYGGTIKFRINNKELFSQISEVQYWIKRGADEQAIKKYATDLVKQAAGEVLGDILQQMINDVDADIRDLTVYHQYMRNNAEKALSIFFERYGLAVEMFTMHEKERMESPALMTLGRAQEHKSVENINKDLYSFDQQMKVDKSAIENKTKIDLDTQAVNTEAAITRNNHGRAQNTIDNMYIQNNVVNAKDDIERQQKLKYESWAREDAESKNEWQHSQKLKGYQYQSELAGAAHNSKMQDYGYQSEISSAVHDANVQNIRQNKEEKQELHYLNQQEIENRAKELRTKWEADNRNQHDQLSSAIQMEEMKWNTQKKFTREQAALENELEQATTENERVINSIMRKISESDLELAEKKAAYNRMLKNLDAEDELKHMINKGNATANLEYNAAHLKNILTKEENDLMEELQSRADARIEKRKNADFIRAMQVEERDNEYRMTILKMEYERDKYKSEMEYERDRHRSDMEYELKTKDKQIEELREKLKYNSHLNDNDVQKASIYASADVEIKKSENMYKASHDNMVASLEEKKQQADIDLENKYMDRLDELLSQVLAIDAAVKKYSFINEKEAIHASANVQMVKAAAEAQSNVAQSVIQHSAMADENSKKFCDDMQARIAEMEEMMRKMKKNIKSIKESSHKKNSREDGDRGYGAPRNNGGSPYTNYGGSVNSGSSAFPNYGDPRTNGGSSYPNYGSSAFQNYGGSRNNGGSPYTNYGGLGNSGSYTSPSYGCDNGSRVSPYDGQTIGGISSSTSAYQGSQPGASWCSKCGALIPVGSFCCPRCGSK